MTKLMEWLTALVILFGIWLALITKTINTSLMDQYPTLLYVSPIICLGIFGIFAATIVLYRVVTFNNCEEASVELQKEIQEATEDLKKRGFIFKT